jgi:hypothetical protein
VTVGGVTGERMKDVARKRLSGKERRRKRREVGGAGSGGNDFHRDAREQST